MSNLDIMDLTCPACGKQVEVKSAMAGRQVPCPHKACGTTIHVPGPVKKRNVHIVLLACAIALAFAGCTKGANTQFTKSELDALEKHLQADPNYRWEILKGDRKRTVALVLAAQKRKPASAELWAGVLGMRFAQDKFEARSLPEKERRERYRDALGYLQDFSQSVESAVKANADKPALNVADSLNLNGDIALAALESGDLDLAKKLAEEMLKNNTDTNSNLCLPLGSFQPAGDSAGLSFERRKERVNGDLDARCCPRP
jgi:hypothetical protein